MTAKRPDVPKGPPADPGADDVAWSEGFILPGGKVDADAMHRALEASRATGDPGNPGAADEADEADEADVALRRVSFRLQRDLQKRLDKYLTDRITFLSRTQLQKLIDEGGVLVNGRAPKASTRVGAGDLIEVVVPPPPSKDIVPENIPLDVLYEDDALIVLSKQPDIIVHPARSHLTGTMLSALAWHFKHGPSTGGRLSGVGSEFARPGVVHRLDRHTSGVIVFAKMDEAHWKLGHQFEHRKVDKRYLAVVRGRVEHDVETIDFPVGPHPSREKGYREKYVVRHDELGKHALTICRVRERYRLGGAPSAPLAPAPPTETAPGWKPAPLAAPTVPPVKLPGDGDDYTLVELELRTGRTHQIRVHLSYLGYPIVGDDMYGGASYADETGLVLIIRQALHATILGFTHPISGAPMRFTAPLRGDMADLVASLRARSGAAWLRVDAPGATVDLDQALPHTDHGRA